MWSTAHLLCETTQPVCATVTLFVYLRPSILKITSSMFLADAKIWYFMNTTASEDIIPYSRTMNNPRIPVQQKRSSIEPKLLDVTTTLSRNHRTMSLLGTAISVSQRTALDVWTRKQDLGPSVPTTTTQATTGSRRRTTNTTRYREHGTTRLLRVRDPTMLQ